MKKLAVLGASYLQLPLVLKAKELGVFVICIAWDDGKAVCKEFADLFFDISVLDKDLILQVCKEYNVDGITTIATDICIPTIAYIVNQMNLKGNSELCALLTTNKTLMHECLQNSRINVPLKYDIETVDDIEKVELNYPLIVKPVDRSGSLAVVKVDNIESLRSAVKEATKISFAKRCIVEEFISGDEVSVETISIDSNHQIITITDKIITSEPYFVELAHHQPSKLDHKIINQIRLIAIATLNATKVENGAGHIEMKVNSNGIYVIEIGSRMGGDFIGSDLVELSTGFDFLKVVILVALDEYEFKLIEIENKYSGVYFLSKDTEYILPWFSQNSDFFVKKQIFNNDLKFAKSSNDRSGYLIYQSDKRIVI